MTSDTPEQPPAAPGGPGAGDQPGEPEPWRDGALRSQHLDVDALSAYLDQQLDPNEMAAARAHLATCPACGQELAELRATVALLRELPQYLPRRTFQLGPEHVRRAAAPGAGFGDWGWFERLVPSFPALRVATVAVAVLLVAVIAGDLVSNRGSGSAPLLQSGDQPAEVANAPKSAPAPAPAVQAPAVEQARPRAVGVGQPASEAAEADQEVAGYAESAPEAGTESAVPASSMAGDDRAEDAPGVVSPAPAAEPEPAAAPPSGWRLAQVGLGLALLWLIVSLVGVARLRRDHS